MTTPSFTTQSQTTQSANVSVEQPGDQALVRLFWLAAVLAVGLQLWLWSRSWLYFDQILLYRLGTDLAVMGELHPWAKAMSGGTILPGSLLQLVIGAPLALWLDFRSPTLLLAMLQLATFPLVYRSMRELTTESGARLLLILWALSPWRLYHSGFLWEPGFVVLLAPVHFWAFVKLRKSTTTVHAIWPSLVLGWVVLAAPQLHPSGVILSVGAGLLLITRQVRPRWWAFAIGLGAGTTTLIGTLRLVATGALHSPSGSDALNLFSTYALKPLAYWIRVPTSDIGRRIRQSDVPGVEIIVVVVSATVLLGLLANWKLWRRSRSKTSTEADRYALTMLVASLLAHALATAHPQGWHSLVLLLATLLPVVALFDTASSRTRNRWLAVVLTIHVMTTVVVGLGHPMFDRPTDPAELRKVAPNNLPFLELVPIPFGSGKENWEGALRNTKSR